MNHLTDRQITGQWAAHAMIRSATVSLPGEHPRLFSLCSLLWAGALAAQSIVAVAGEFSFQHHFADRTLPVTERLVGDYGLTALADLDGDGDLDFVLGGRPAQPSQLYWYEFQGPERWARHLAGTNYLSDVGLAAFDVDRDGWIDLVCSGVWYRNPGKPRTQSFERRIFDPKGAGAHDIVIADMDADSRPDVVMMGDERTQLNALCWYSISADPNQIWTRHPVGAPVHGAITPNGVGDVDGDGDPDIVRADTWFENRDGIGLQWVAHANISMGRKGPYGICVRTAIVDVDGDGRMEVVIADADITDSKVAVLTNGDGKGGRWQKQLLPRSFVYGSLHSLAVADFNGDGRPDLAVNEQEELLPEGRENPRWVIWENLGGGNFAERIILDQKLGGHELQAADVDRDGDIDICSKPWGPRAWNGAAGRMHVDFLENLTIKR